MANATFTLTPDDVRNLVARYAAGLSLSLGEPDLDVRFVDPETGEETDPPAVRVEALPTKSTVTLIAFSEDQIPDAFRPDEEGSGDDVVAHAGNNGAH